MTTIAINYKITLQSENIPDNCLDISNNNINQSLDILKSFIINKGLVTIINFNNYNFFHTFFLNNIFIFIINKIPDSIITLRNLSDSMNKFICNLKVNKLYDTNLLPFIISEKIIKNFNYILTFTNKKTTYKFLFITQLDEFKSIKSNIINKIYHLSNFIYYETEIFNKTSYQFIKNIQDF